MVPCLAHLQEAAGKETGLLCAPTISQRVPGLIWCCPYKTGIIDKAVE
jgi:hypothetical protein